MFSARGNMFNMRLHYGFSRDGFMVRWLSTVFRKKEATSFCPPLKVSSSKSSVSSPAGVSSLSLTIVAGLLAINAGSVFLKTLWIGYLLLVTGVVENRNGCTYLKKISVSSKGKEKQAGPRWPPSRYHDVLPRHAKSSLSVVELK